MLKCSDGTLEHELPPVPQSEPFFDKWSFYFHLSNDTQWNLESYKLIMKDIQKPETLIELKKHMHEKIIVKSMLFIMRNGIAPMWEDPSNIKGGSFSFKISSNVIYYVWWDFVYLLCGHTLMKNPDNMKLVNGITMSPKYEHSIIKIWLKDLSLQDYNELNVSVIEKLEPQKPIFKKHGNDK